MAEPVRLPRLLTEKEAAEALGVSKATLVRLRRAGRITFTRIRGRIRYTEDHLLAYIEGETQTCRENERTAPARSGTTGSAAGRTRPPGAGRGSIPQVDRSAAHRLAKTIFGKPN